MTSEQHTGCPCRKLFVIVDNQNSLERYPRCAKKDTSYKKALSDQGRNINIRESKNAVLNFSKCVGMATSPGVHLLYFHCEPAVNMKTKTSRHILIKLL